MPAATWGPDAAVGLVVGGHASSLRGQRCREAGDEDPATYRDRGANLTHRSRRQWRSLLVEPGAFARIRALPWRNDGSTGVRVGRDAAATGRWRSLAAARLRCSDEDRGVGVAAPQRSRCASSWSWSTGRTARSCFAVRVPSFVRRCSGFMTTRLPWTGTGAATPEPIDRNWRLAVRRCSYRLSRCGSRSSWPQPMARRGWGRAVPEGSGPA